MYNIKKEIERFIIQPLLETPNLIEFEVILDHIHNLDNNLNIIEVQDAYGTARLNHLKIHSEELKLFEIYGDEDNLWDYLNNYKTEIYSLPVTISYTDEHGKQKVTTWDIISDGENKKVQSCWEGDLSKFYPWIFSRSFSGKRSYYLDREKCQYLFRIDETFYNTFKGSTDVVWNNTISSSCTRLVIKAEKELGVC